MTRRGGLGLSLIFLALVSGCATGRLTDSQYAALSWNKAVAIQVDYQGNRISNPAYGYCHSQPSKKAARDCAVNSCKSFSRNLGLCVVAIENNIEVLQQSLAYVKKDRMKSEIASIRNICKGYGFDTETELETCMTLEASRSRQPVSTSGKTSQARSGPNWGAISQLGKDILSGEAWPTNPQPRAQAPVATPSCMQNGSYMSSNGKYKICLYSCGAGGQQSRTVSQYSMCPLSP
jgi:hypothetical protein